MTLTDLCGELNNYFDVLRIYGEFEISNNSIDLSNYNVHEGQYIRIVGSEFHLFSRLIHSLLDRGLGFGVTTTDAGFKFFKARRDDENR